MGRHKATYQRFAPNPPQDHSVRGHVPHKVPTRDGKGVAGVLALDSSLRSTASRHFWGRCSTAPLPEESAGQFATGNLSSGALLKWGRLKHTGKKSAVRRKESSLCQTSQSLSSWKIGNFTANGPPGGHCPPGSNSNRPPAALQTLRAHPQQVENSRMWGRQC